MTLHFEVLVAFGTAEAEDFGVVTDEGDSFGWVDRTGAEMARFDPRICQGQYRKGEVVEGTNLMVAVWLDERLCLEFASRTGPAQFERY